MAASTTAAATPEAIWQPTSSATSRRSIAHAILEICASRAGILLQSPQKEVSSNADRSSARRCFGSTGSGIGGLPRPGRAPGVRGCSSPCAPSTDDLPPLVVKSTGFTAPGA
ncbi:hypothetical protein GCM10018779_52680 [Streptomyces griseocarneus]|nr:hypothetical protein GCM10018779_52680 [Streptomyces griseocarneus]